MESFCLFHFNTEIHSNPGLKSS